MRFTITLLISFFLSNYSFSQNVHHFTKGLSVSGVHHYGREAIYTDQLAYQLYTNTLRKPAVGDSFGVDNKGQAIKWQVVVADSLNRFRSRGFGASGYFYFT